MSETAGSRHLAWAGPVMALVLALLFLVTGWATVGDYGITWDEPENFITGDLYWQFFRTGDRAWLDFETLKNQWAVADEKPLFYVYTMTWQERYPPAANLVSAIAGWLLDEQLGWADAIDAHHSAIPFFGALGVLVTTLFAWQAHFDRRSLAPCGRSCANTTGTRPYATDQQGAGRILASAIVAGGSLALFPLYWGHAHNNIKDVPMAALFAATLWAGWRAFGRDRSVNWPWALTAGILWGLALGTKANGIVILPVMAAWLIGLWAWPGYRAWRAERSWKQFIIPAFVTIILGSLTLLAVWPYLWDDPVRRLYGVFRYFTSAGAEFPVFFEGQMYVVGETLPWRYALTHLVLTTPLVVLTLAGAGVVKAVKETWRGENSASTLWLIWLGATLLRVSLPGMVVYNGLRQVMELLPAVCLMAGLGAGWIWETIQQKVLIGRPAAKWIGVAALALLFVPQVITLARLHPYEGAFFNALAGGEQRASQNYTLEYWGQSYKDGGEWLNHHAGEDAWVAVPIAGHLARYSLRPDLELVSTNEVSDLVGREGEGYVMVMHNWDRYGGPDQTPVYCETHCEVLHTVEADGAVLLTIYRWESELS